MSCFPFFRILACLKTATCKTCILRNFGYAPNFYYENSTGLIVADVQVSNWFFIAKYEWGMDSLVWRCKLL